MKEIKRCISNFAFCDQAAIEKKLTQMASQGWMIHKAGDLFWTYEKAEPKQLRFAVTYFPDASEFDPSPSEKQLDKEDLCAQDGWRLVLRWDAMQIFCNENLDAVPIETDPVPQVANIHRVMRKRLLTGRIPLFLTIALSLFTQLADLRRDPLDYLSSGFSISMLLMWLMLLAQVVYQMISYFHWHHRAKKAAEDGVFLPMSINWWMAWGWLALMTVFLLYTFAGSKIPRLVALCYGGMMVVIIFLARGILKWMKEQGVSRQLNQGVTMLSIFLAVVLGTSVLIREGIHGWLPVEDTSRAVGTYEHYGTIRKIYDDPLPLEIEELADVDTQWSKEADPQETFLLSKTEYHQYVIPVRGVYKPEQRELSYTVIDVKQGFLQNFFRNAALNARQDETNDDVVFIDHYEPVDATVWNADAAYQLHWSDSVLDTYLVFWGNRIVEIQFYWEPTPEQIALAAEKLSNP